MRFFNSSDLIGCGGDPQPMRFKVHGGVGRALCAPLHTPPLLTPHAPPSCTPLCTPSTHHSMHPSVHPLHTSLCTPLHTPPLHTPPSTPSAHPLCTPLHRPLHTPLHAPPQCTPHTPVCTEGVCRGAVGRIAQRNHWLPLATIDLVSDNREIQV